MKLAVWAVFLVLGTGAAQAQTPDDLPVDVAYREKLLNLAAQRYDSLYVSAEKAKLIRDRLMSKAVRARYADCATARCLTTASRRICTPGAATSICGWCSARHRAR